MHVVSGKPAGKNPITHLVMCDGRKPDVDVNQAGRSNNGEWEFDVPFDGNVSLECE